jgi:hypothetical protein
VTSPYTLDLDLTSISSWLGQRRRRGGAMRD